MANAALRNSALELMTAIATNPLVGPVTRYQAEQNMRKWGAAPAETKVNREQASDFIDSLFGGLGKGWH